MRSRYFANPRRDLPKVRGSGELIGSHRVTSIFDPRKKLDEGVVEPLVKPPPPRAAITDLGSTTADVAWELPSDDDGQDNLELRGAELQLSRFETVWEEKQEQFFEDYRPFVPIHKGGVNVTSKQLVGLDSGCRYRTRVRCFNKRLQSDWSDVVEFSTAAAPAGGGAGGRGLPPSWIRVDLSDILKKQLGFSSSGARGFFMQLGEALLPYVSPIRMLFKSYAQTGISLGAATGGGGDAVPTMTPLQFSNFVRYRRSNPRRSDAASRTVPRCVASVYRRRMPLQVRAASSWAPFSYGRRYRRAISSSSRCRRTCASRSRTRRSSRRGRSPDPNLHLLLLLPLLLLLLL
jgi:hypothetical protein